MRTDCVGLTVAFPLIFAFGLSGWRGQGVWAHNLLRQIKSFVEEAHMLKIILWIVGIIFLVGVLVVSGCLSMIF
jgi:hypothetical protein